MNWSISPYRETIKIAVLRRFQVQEGKESAFKECLRTLADQQITQEHLHAPTESVFTRQLDQHLFLYWLSIDKPGTQAHSHGSRKLVSTLKKLIDLTSYREFQPDQTMFEELKGPHQRHDPYLPGFVIASLIEATPTQAIF